MNDQPFSLALGERDWWPLTRLLAVAFSFGLLAHCRFGWNPPLRDLWALPGGLATIFLFAVALSSTLAHVFLIAAAIPLCGIILLNDWLYDATCWILRTVLRLRSRISVAVLGLCGEVALFGGIALLIRKFLVGI